MPTARTGIFWLLVAGVALAVTLAAIAWSPYGRATDEANYIATARKIARHGRIVAAVHHPVDVIRFGLDHKPVKMPAYMIVLAGWFTLDADPAHVRVLNLTVYALAVVLLWWGIVLRGQSPTFDAATVSLAMLLTSPLGLVYANTAMMESFVLFVAVLHWLSWFLLAGKRWRLHAFALTALLAVATKESLALLTVAILIACRDEVGAECRAIVARGRLATVASLGWAVAMVVLAALAASGRGYFPNFRRQLLAADGFDTRLRMLGDQLAQTCGDFFRWNEFPQDYLHLLTGALFAMAWMLAWNKRTTVERGLYHSVALFFLLSLLFVFLLYKTDYFNGQRVFEPAHVLTLAVAARWVVGREGAPVEGHPARRRLLRSAAAVGIIVVQVALVAKLDDFFRHERRSWSDEPHVLTRMGLPRPGDCLFAHFDWQYLVDNPDGELINPLPRQAGDVQAVIDKARPRFVILPVEQVWNSSGYCQVADLPPAPGETRGPRSRPQWLWVRDE